MYSPPRSVGSFLDGDAALALDHCLVVTICSECMIVGLEQHDSRLAGEVIGEGDVVEVAPRAQVRAGP